MAHFSGDDHLIEAFLRGDDIHTYTAALIFDADPTTITSLQRSQAKAVNFGIIYGQQAFGLAAQLGISRQESARFIAAYFERYPGVARFIEACKVQARESGRAQTLWGRQRFLPDIASSNANLRALAERLAVNTPIQGTGADLIKAAMKEVDRQLRQRGLHARMLLQIHDELLFEVPSSEIETLSALVKEAMEKVETLAVPLVVNVSVGKNWQEC
jgi:DNA polymerase-1